MQAWACIETSSRPPNAPPTPASVKRTFSTGRSRQAATWSRSTCSHWVAIQRSTPPSSAGIASPDSGPRKAWSCIPTSYSPLTTTSASPGSSPCAMWTWRSRLPAGCSGGESGESANSGIGQRLELLVVDLDPVGGAARGLGVVGGDDRHRLALIADLGERQHGLVVVLEPVRLAAGHVLVGQHRVHARDRQRGADLDRPDARAGMRRAQRRAPQHVLGPHVRRVGELALDLRDPVGPAHGLRRRRRGPRSWS